MTPRRLATLLLLACGLAAAGAPALPATSPTASGTTGTTADVDPLLWPEPQRAFVQDGPGLLLTAEQRRELAALDAAGRERFIREFLDRDPVPGTRDNELRAAIENRRRLVDSEYLSPLDVRAQIVFLNGKPDEREVIDCGTAFKPLEIWTYRGTAVTAGTAGDAGDAGEPGGTGKPRQGRLVVYQPTAGEPWRLWESTDSKELLYTPEMIYWLQQWEELGGWGIARRFDLQICKQADKVDKATGVPGLSGARPRRQEKAANRPDSQPERLRRSYGQRPWQGGPGEAEGFLEAPHDLAAWSRRALAGESPKAPPSLEVGSIEVQFPERAGQRIVARLYVQLPRPPAPAADAEGKPQIQLVVDGVVESEGRAFEDFRLRYRMAPQEQGPLDLEIDRPLRPERQFLVRLRIRDEGSGAETRVARGFLVPKEPLPLPPVARAIAPVPGDDPRGGLASGPDTLTLLPPQGEVQVGLWRAEALVTGKRIAKVVFSVDGQKQLVRSRPPFSAELRLSKFPTEQVVKVEGFDEADQLVASDQVALNQPRGSFRVNILDPPRGSKPSGRVTARAEVILPEGARLAAVEFRVNDKPVATLKSPPWQAQIDVPEGEEVVYLAVSAQLEGGSTAEDVRFLRAPEYLEEVEVDLVELYATVTNRSGELVRDLKQEDFQVFEAGERQDVLKFELVENLPLTVGVTLDTSGSMTESLGEAQRAATEFLKSVVTPPKDRCFTLTFSGRPVLRMPMSDDVEAAARSLEGLTAVGPTSLHDAIVHSLYYFRGIYGQKALVLLSDGDDTSSDLAFKDALEYARRSGVAIYAIGLNVPAGNLGVRNKLNNLAQETGAQSYFIGRAEELAGVYERIEQELRSRYLIAFNAKRAAGKEGYRPVEVRVTRGGLKARTARGYYP